ncbi:MAG: hypothetical protein ACI308_11555 [Muribaculaceae bacterium]
MNDVFNITRFGLLIKKDLTENYRLYLIGTASLLFGLFTIMVFTTPMVCEASTTIERQTLSTIPFFYIYVFGCMISASLMFSPMRTKQGRISLFTLPATTAEKYLEQVLVNIVGFTIAYAACIEIAELLRCVFSPLFWNCLFTSCYSDNYSAHINHFNAPNVFAGELNIVLSTIGLSSNKLLLLIGLGALIDLGVFSLGAVLWPKYSFIKTYAATYVVGIAIMILLLVGIAVFPFFTDVDTKTQVLACYYTVVALQILVIIGSFAASYILFKRKNVIHPSLF